MELAIHEISIFVLREEHQLSGEVSEGDDLLPLQFGDVVEHLVLAHFEVVFFEGAHDVGIGGGGHSLDGVVGVFFGTVGGRGDVAGPAVQVHLYILLHLLYLHDLRLQRRVLLHVALVDAVQFGQDRYFEVVHVVVNLLLEVLHLLDHSQLLALDGFLAGGQVALLVLEKLMYFLWEELDLLHEVPQVV